MKNNKKGEKMKKVLITILVASTLCPQISYCMENTEKYKVWEKEVAERKQEEERIKKSGIF